MKITDLAWMAAVLDVKGKIFGKVNASRKTVQLVLAVDTKEQRVLWKLCDMTGTTADMRVGLSFRNFTRRNCNEHCPDAHVHVGGDTEQPYEVGRWTVTGAAMVTVLFNLAPFIQVDRGYLAAMDTVNAGLALTGQGSGMVLSSLRRLRDLGWNLPPHYSATLDARQQLVAQRGGLINETSPGLLPYRARW